MDGRGWCLLPTQPQTLTRCVGSLEAGVESMYFFKSWLTNSNTRYSFLSLCTTSSSLEGGEGRAASQQVGW